MNIYDPKVEPEQIIFELTNPYVTDSPEKVKNAITIHDDPYVSVERTHAIILCTEWDEFVVSTKKICSYKIFINIHIENYPVPSQNYNRATQKPLSSRQPLNHPRGPLRGAQDHYRINLEYPLNY